MNNQLNGFLFNKLPSVQHSNDGVGSISGVLTDSNGSSKQSKFLAANSSVSSNKNRIVHTKSPGIHVGRDYQAVIPDFIPIDKCSIPNLKDRDLIIWAPNTNMPENALQQFIGLAQRDFGYNEEQALALLMWHKHDFDTAAKDLEKYSPMPVDWTREDRVLFQQAYICYGKNFIRIQQMLPEKTLGNLMAYYYSWKKKAKRDGVLNRQLRSTKIEDTHTEK